ncbi:MAG: hypothetical protein H0W07_05340, partial [Chloroflexi bacterium]|nr:hypothetical protein [Chloroflexota bacterium]
ARPTTGGALVGLLLTGGYRPSERVLAALRDARLFAYLVPDDTYQAASTVHDLLVKTHPDDREKIELTKRVVAEHLDVDRILARFERGRPVRRGQDVRSAASTTRPAASAGRSGQRAAGGRNTVRRIAGTLRRMIRSRS